MILTEVTKDVINTDEIGRGTLVWAKHSSWEEGRSGIVTNATEKDIVITFLPSFQNVRNHFTILASELVDGQWQLRYSSDGLQNVSSFGFATEEENTENESEG